MNKVVERVCVALTPIGICMAVFCFWSYNVQRILDILSRYWHI